MLNATVIHVFKIRLDPDMTDFTASDLALLDASEYQRAVKLKITRHQQQFIQTHIGLRKILMRYTRRNPVIQKTPAGKPFLRDFPALEFNLSHTENMALCAVNLQTPIGIDIEYIAKNKKINYWSIAKRFFSTQENLVLSLSQQPEIDFLMLWTRKESYLKAMGTGIFSGFLPTMAMENFIFYKITPDKNYIATLALEKQAGNKKIIYEGYGT